MFILKETIIKMIKKLLFIGAVYVIIGLMLSACGKKNSQKQNDLNISNSQNIDIGEDILESPSSEQGDKSNYRLEVIEGKAGIENVTIESGQINFQIRNLTTDNILLTAYLEYVRLENGEETGDYSMDCEGINISVNDISDMLSFNPQKPLGKEGIIKIKELVFENEKDNYNRE